MAAFEVAQHLAASGVIVRGIVLIDSPSPIIHVAIPQNIIDEHILGPIVRASSLGKIMRIQLHQHATLLSDYVPQDPVVALPITLLRSVEAFAPEGVQGVPGWLCDRKCSTDRTLGWNAVACSDVKVLDIPGHHFSPFQIANVNYYYFANSGFKADFNRLIRSLNVSKRLASSLT